LAFAECFEFGCCIQLGGIFFGGFDLQRFIAVGWVFPRGQLAVSIGSQGDRSQCAKDKCR